MFKLSTLKDLNSLRIRLCCVALFLGVVARDVLVLELGHVCKFLAHNYEVEELKEPMHLIQILL